MQGFVGDYEDFEQDVLAHWEPVKVLEYWGDMVIFLRMTDQSDSRILDRLEFLDDVIRQAGKDAISVVQSGGYQ